MLMFHYDLGDSEQRIVEVRRRVDDGQYHYVTFIRHDNNVTVQLDDLPVRTRLHGIGLTLSFYLYLQGERLRTTSLPPALRSQHGLSALPRQTLSSYRTLKAHTE